MSPVAAAATQRHGGARRRLRCMACAHTVLALALACTLLRSASGGASATVQPAGSSIGGSGGSSSGGVGTASSSARALLHVERQGEVVAETGAKRCPPLSRALFERRAKDGVVMFAVINSALWDFGRNWLHHIKGIKLDYYVIAAADESASARLAAAGEPCFEWFDAEAVKLGLKWGEEGWRRMTWSKVFILQEVIDYGFNLVISDVDAVWFRDPAPLFDRHKLVDVLVGLDHGESINAPGDDGLETFFHPDGCDFNTGVYLVRYGANVSAWAHAWATYFSNCDSHDQVCCYRLVRTGDVEALEGEGAERIYRAWHRRIRMAAMPVSLFQSGHTRFVQALHEAKGVRPYAVHATWVFGGVDGKRARMRDMGLWADPPAYYETGDFVALDLAVPEPPANLNTWKENEDMISIHLGSIHRQLQQAYVGAALAHAAGRAFILPKFQCYCEKMWYGVVRCRMFDAQGFPLPITCPTDYLFEPALFTAGAAPEEPPLDLREPPFLDCPRTPAAVKESVLIVRPSAAVDCAACVQELPAAGGAPAVAQLPPGLTFEAALRLLEPFRRYRVWRLDLAGVGSWERAFSGFEDRQKAAAFDTRIAHITTEWCCRRPEEAPRYHLEQSVNVPLTMTSMFSYSGGRSRSLQPWRRQQRRDG